MSRSGYYDDGDDQWGLIRWRGAVTSAIRGRKGQAFLAEVLAALDAMPVKELIGQSFKAEGAYCTLGAVAEARGVEIPARSADKYGWDFDARHFARKALKIPDALAAEIMYWNDEGGWYNRDETPAERWSRMRKWVAEQIKTGAPQ